MDLFAAETKNKRIFYKSKDLYKASHQKNSPDLTDSICLRSVFELDARPKKQPSPEVPDDAYDGLFNSYRRGGRTRVYIS